MSAKHVFPMQSGQPLFQMKGDVCTFGNDVIALRWTVKNERLADFWLIDLAGESTLPIIAPFALMLANGSVVEMGQLTLAGPISETMLAPNPDAARLAERIAGRSVSVALIDAQGRLQVEWSVEQRNGSRYLRAQLAITALLQNEEIAVVSLLEMQATEAQASLERRGTPIIAGHFFLGFELPLAESHIEGDRIRFTLHRTLPLEKDKTLSYSTVAGVVRDGQLRRDFATYLQRERAHPYRPFLHYNSWADIGYLTPYTEDQALERIGSIGRELVDARGVQIDSFLFDDGWDDLSGHWRFSRDFPQGFERLRDAAERYGAAPGIWLSPWGGYCAPQQERVTRGRAAGYEVIGNGFALSGPNYYRRFHEVVMTLLAHDGVNQFKFDGTGNANQVFAGSLFDSDWDAAIQLIDDIRRVKPETFINLSTGTHPSPFWLRYADSIWRDGKDDDLAGTGTNRERWITYRDAQTYHNVVVRSPFFPLNSLMLHGIFLAQCNPRLNTVVGDDFTHEVRSYFGSGTQLQELYITPSLLSESDWDVLGDAARWARENSDVLSDSHWIGGAPDQQEIYGWAAWTPHKAIITLRNPGDCTQSFQLDLRRHLELPHDADSQFAIRVVWSERATTVRPDSQLADQPWEIEMAAFEVLTLELLPIERA